MEGMACVEGDVWRVWRVEGVTGVEGDVWRVEDDWGVEDGWWVGGWLAGWPARLAKGSANGRSGVVRCGARQVVTHAEARRALVDKYDKYGKYGEYGEYEWCVLLGVITMTKA